MMSVKILHAADFHLDSPFEALTPEMASVRRQEQRDLMDKVTALAEEEHVQLVLLSGDLLDSDTSYFETQDVLIRTFSRIRAEVFIAPGNHDYYCPKSPYAYVKFPPNVHIFKSPQISGVTLPELGCRVWGAGFNDRYSKPLLTGFKAPESGLTEIMVLHGDTAGDAYNHIREVEIASSGLNYLALGHVHSFSGIQTAGKTAYAYPGCPEGRGFDETDEKGVIIGTVSETGCSLQFRPMAGRTYRVRSINMTGSEDAAVTVLAALPPDTARDIYRIILTGEYPGSLDLQGLKATLSDRFFHVNVLDQTKLPRDIWEGIGDDTLRGIFLRKLKERYDSSDDTTRGTVLTAVRYGLAALLNAEEYGA